MAYSRAGVGTTRSSAFTMEIDEAALLRAQTTLARWRDPQLTRILRAAALAGARVLRPPLRAATPVGVNPPRYAPGALARAVRIAYSRKSSRAYGIAYVVGPMGKEAYTRYWVTGGTARHPIRARRTFLGFPDPGHPVRGGVSHPGQKANPYVRRVGVAYRPAVRAAMLRTIAQAAARKGIV